MVSSGPFYSCVLCFRLLFWIRTRPARMSASVRAIILMLSFSPGLCNRQARALRHPVAIFARIENHFPHNGFLAQQLPNPNSADITLYDPKNSKL